LILAPLSLSAICFSLSWIASGSSVPQLKICV
jgi:hypothetical protein